MMKTAGIMLACLAITALPRAACAHEPWPRPPFTATMSNTVPLFFGMTVEEAAAALNAPMKYIRGTPGDEVFAVPRRASAGYFDRHDQVFLLFRRGRLTGWKGDWGRNWMWD